ncbi:unnamed protein product [Sphagnum jensenii]|uniref:Molybdenum cofactor sulfurase n=1 Tax=Sphagnum jensenii TaxID=128206 RepID=A0ABP0W408_9BRYO
MKTNLFMCKLCFISASSSSFVSHQRSNVFQSLSWFFNRTGTANSFSKPESIPSLQQAFTSFKQAYPRFEETAAVDQMRESQYGHLEEDGHVCLDYNGFGLFSQWQQVMEHPSSSFGLAYISANLSTHAMYGTAEEGSLESYIRKRIMRFMNVNEAEYSMVFTSSGGSAYKLLAESYPFHVNNRLLTSYDYESEALDWMVTCARDKGAKILNATFKWPSMRIVASDLKYKLRDKKKKKEQQAKGLFVFPVQSRLTGAKYSHQWMSQAQANKWHVLLDASALGPKDMDSLGLSLFRPEFIITSFYKVFGADPTGFGCLFIKNSAIPSLQTSSRARGVGMVRIISSGASSSFSAASEQNIECTNGDEEEEDTSVPEIMESDRIEEFAEDWSSPGNHVCAASFLDRMSAGGSVNSGLDSEVGSTAGSEIARSEIEEGEVRDQGYSDNLRAGDMGKLHKGTSISETSLSDGKDVQLARNGDAESQSPFLVKHLEAPEVLRKMRNVNHEISEHSEIIILEDEIGKGGEEDTRPESSDLGSSVIRKGDEEHFLMEGRGAGSFSRHRQILSSVRENFEGQADLDVSEPEAYDYDGTNGRRMQYWSPGEGSNEWAKHYAMSTDGSPMYYDDEEGGSEEDSEPEMMDDKDGVVCSGLDHADSQGLNKTNRRLRYLTNWLINALLKLQHPVQTGGGGGGGGVPLVYIYGPEVQFDRGASLAFNIFDWNGVLVQPTLVQRLADRSNISLGLGRLCNVIYPEGRGKTGGKLETPRASNANKGNRPSSINVVTATLGFVTNFEDIHRMWEFVAKFLDVDFVSQEGWQYHSLNQEMVVL